MKPIFSIIFLIISSNLILAQTTNQSSPSKGSVLSKKGIDLPQTEIKYPYYNNINKIWLKPEAAYFTYDYSGNKTSELLYDNEYLYKYFYNEQGLLTIRINFTKSRINLLYDTSSFYFYTYDSLNNITNYKLKNYRNSYFWPNIKYTNTYNEKKQLTKIITEEFDYIKNVSKISSIENFLYDSSGSLIEVNQDAIDSSASNIRRKKYQWFEWNGDIQNSKASSIIEEVGIKNNTRRTYNYDSLGNQIEYKLEVWNDSIWSMKSKYDNGEWEKDSLKYKGNTIIQKIVMKLNESDQIFKPKEKYVYSDFVNVNVGIKKQTENENKLYIYPNPSNGNFYIESNQTNISSIAIFNLTGKIVFNIFCKNKFMQIDLSELNNGVYFINTTLENGFIKNSKIIITK